MRTNPQYYRARYIVYCLDPKLRRDTQICRKVNKSEADARCAKLNKQALDSYPGRPPMSIPLYYVVYERVKVREDVNAASC